VGGGYQHKLVLNTGRGMDTDQGELLQALLRWLATFSVEAAHETVEECSDGLAMAQVLHLLAPGSFDTTWLSKVSAVGGNKRLKLANLRKVTHPSSGLHSLHSLLPNSPSFSPPCQAPPIPGSTSLQLHPSS